MSKRVYDYIKIDLSQLKLILSGDIMTNRIKELEMAIEVAKKQDDERSKLWGQENRALDNEIKTFIQDALIDVVNGFELDAAYTAYFSEPNINLYFKLEGSDFTVKIIREGIYYVSASGRSFSPDRGSPVLTNQDIGTYTRYYATVASVISKLALTNFSPLFDIAKNWKFTDYEKSEGPSVADLQQELRVLNQIEKMNAFTFGSKWDKVEEVREEDAGQFGYR